MKRLPIMILLFSFTLLFSLCKKGDTGPAGATGPAGPTGATGAQGPIGVQGNANVVQYNYGAFDFSASSVTSLLVTTTQDTMNQSAWFVYLVTSSALVYPIPGYAYNGASQYRVYWYYLTDKVNFVVSRITGSGEAYGGIRIIRIYANNSTAGGRMDNALPDIDFKDYHAVCKYYHLKEE